MTARFVRANGLRFAYREQGPADGPLALCLHGFPDTPATFRHLLPALADAGFHAVAPWSRGYPPTDVPADKRIDPDTLTADVNALHRAFGGSRDAVLVGHDWGAIAAMRAAAAAPERWRRLVTLAVPPERVLAGVAGDGRQLARSRYALAALVPGADHRLAAGDAAGYVRLWKRWSPGYEPTEDDLAPLKAAVRSPGAGRAMVAYYRGFAPAVLRRRALSPRVTLPPQPHLVLHGRQDGCIGVEWAERAEGRLPHPASRTVIIDDAGHFLHLEQPERVARLTLGHLLARGTAAAVD
ncbi:alpha/beta fold hydrolase [Egicoccus halophilus]|uniref:Epoxide hydrolase n=1 Tax=Egicoccus halophilus TaxID=1670830 RepID=A0A8J3AAY1_9ACTN|nr:alpha/beta hydrolase [Egicoccus halophilus]GGI06901.1 epoxide hydrolase [Egicoccus halophilus]